MITWGWNHRHEIKRWGRSLWNELTSPAPISPSRVSLIGKVLWAVTKDRDLSNAKQLRGIHLSGDVVELDVDRRWNRTARLVSLLQGVDGVREVRIRGQETVPTVISTTAA
jgi:hypothetical protein